jgi:periplasmic protein TonB
VQIENDAQIQDDGPPPDFVPVEKTPQPIPGNNPPPVYPEIARRAGVEGTVWVKIWVDKEGNPKKAVVQKSDAELFNQPAIDAAMKWKFTPAIMNNGPVSVWVSIPFKFRLNQGR